MAASLLVLGVSPGPTPLVANEPPKNTAAIDSLTPEQARKLVKRSSGVTIDVQVRSKPSQEFHQLHNTLPLNGLKLLDADTAKELAKHADGSLLLNGLKTLSADAAAALADYKGQRLELSGLTAIDADVAKWLAAVNVNALDLDGLTALRADAATALAEAKAHALSLDADTARSLVPIETWNGVLPELTAFESPDSVAVAEVLATRTSPLLLPNLKKISPKTLTVLIKKEDVFLPPIETLELIPEPNGSPTDDFVIPDGFAERQREQQGE